MIPGLDAHLTTPPDYAPQCVECGCDIEDDAKGDFCFTCQRNAQAAIRVAEDATTTARRYLAILRDVEQRLARGDATPHVLNALRKALTP